MIYRVILLLLLCSSTQAQIFNAAPFQAVGNTGIALRSVYSTANNAAGLNSIQKPEIAIAYQPNFISSELNTQAIFVAIPFQSHNTLGIALHRYGLAGVSSLLNISGAYVRTFGKIISTSISFNYHSFSVKNYGRDNTYSVDLGAQISISKDLDIGLIGRNISQQMFAEDIDQYIPRELGIGLKYDISKDLFISSDIYYDPIQKTNIRAGISYTIDKLIALRAGASNGPIQYYAGIGLILDNLRIDCSSSFHSQLGSSPQIALNYVF